MFVSRVTSIGWKQYSWMQTRLGNNCYGLLSHLETVTMVPEMHN